MMHRATPPAPPRRAPLRGMAALTVVMVLFFVMALVAAYTSRNLIFEQRISANTYRAARALAAADAGVDWTLAMLNSGRVDLNCQPSLDPADIDFRSRYLSSNSPAEAVVNGGYEVITWGAAPGTRLYPACINRNGVLTCVCPTVATPAPAMAVPADGIGSSFRVSFWLPGNASRPGAMEFAARGCASPGTGNTACFAPSNAAMPAVDSMTSALTTVGLLRALPVVPKATLTAGTVVDATAGDLRVGNSDATSGLTVHAGGAITAPVGQFEGPAGSGSDGRLASDASLATLAAAANEGWFRAMFGMDPATYQRQPAVVRVNCAAGCTLADLANVLAGHPRNPIWVEGDLNLATAGVMGSAVDPLLLIVNGNLTVAADLQITGFVHANAITWAPGAETARLRGAMAAASRFTATTIATLSYDKAVLDIIRLRYGSFVRAPGSWNLTTVN